MGVSFDKEIMEELGAKASAYLHVLLGFDDMQKRDVAMLALSGTLAKATGETDTELLVRLFAVNEALKEGAKSAKEN